MAALLSLMALYGALDPATSDSDRSLVADVAARYLPGTAGAAGWYSNIVEVFRGDGEEPPDPEDALTQIINGDDKLTVPELSRFVYVAGALCHTPRFDAMTLQPDSLLARALALAGPHYNGGDDADVARGYDLLQQLSAEFRSADDWDDVAIRAAARGVLSPNVAAVPRCRPSTQQVDGYDCVVIDTDFGRPDIYLQKLKDVVDPLNWARNYPHMFCQMDAQAPAVLPNGWSRVLETVSVGCQQGWVRLVTPLKYYKSEAGPGLATVQYELDTSAPNLGDGRVKVDRGFIKMWATADPTAPGVRVRTRKIVHIEPLLPQAQAPFVCGSGYADMAKEMLFGNAADPPKDTVPWQPSSPPDEPRAFAAGGPSSAAPKAGSSGQVASVTTQLWIDFVKDVADRNLELSRKWWKNQLTVDELVAYSREVGGQWASAPWRLFQALSQPPDDAPKDRITGGDF